MKSRWVFLILAVGRGSKVKHMPIRGGAQTQKNAFGANVVSREAPDSATDNRGSVLPQADSPTRGDFRGRSAYMEPEDFTPGPNSDVGVGSRGARSQSCYDLMADDWAVPEQMGFCVDEMM